MAALAGPVVRIRLPPSASLSHQGWLDRMKDYGRHRICGLALEQLDAVS